MAWCSLSCQPRWRSTHHKPLGDVKRVCFIAAGIFAGQQNEGRFATVAVEKITFIKPVFVGDQVSCYCKLLKTGSTSITMKVETWVCRFRGRATEKVADGDFIFVAIDEDRRPVEHGL